MDMVQCPPQTIGGGASNKYPAIYKDTHEYVGNVPLKDYVVGDVLVFSNCTYEILEIMPQQSGKDLWRIRRITNGQFEPVSDREKIESPQSAACGIFRRKRSSGAAAGGGSKTIADFPHSCTRCGLASYNGLHEVVHADEGAARGCPAPRGNIRR